MFHEFQKFLPKAAAEYNFTRQLEAVKICQEFRSLSKNLLSPEAAGQTFPKSFDGKTLTVGVLNSACAQQVAMLKHRFLEGIHKKYGSKALQNIKIEMTDRLPGTAID